jgi:hypothetical protein
LSLFLPLSPGSPRSTKTRIRAKNVLARAEQVLRSDGLPHAEIDHLVGQARRALGQVRPLGANHAGLAVFVDRDSLHLYDVPARLPEAAVVGERFVITPLLPALDMQGTFFLLTMTQDVIRLFKGTSLSLQRVQPDGLELAAWTTMPRPRAPQVHAFLADRGGHGTRSVFHGVERESDRSKTRILEHFRGTDRALRRVLDADRAPLVLAGVRQLQVLYRAASTYPRLLLAGINGSPEQMSEEELHRRAWALAQPELLRGRSAAVRRYLDLGGTGRTVTGVGETRVAATKGQVDTLLINESACVWNSPVVRLDSLPAAVEQLDFAAVATLARDGDVFVVPESDMPERSSAVAILRY